MKGRLFFCLLLIPVFLLPLSAQEAAAGSGGSPSPLSRGFREVTLGLSLEETKAKLLEDPWFLFRGDPDVSLLASPNESLIDCPGASYISRALFQFDEKTLYTISLVLDEQRVDYYSLFTSLRDKYGEFQSLSPQMVVWDDGVTRISLERPLTVKYIDREIFDRKRMEARRGANLDDLSRQDFLKMF